MAVEIFPTSKRAPAASVGSFQVNLAVFDKYHFVGSGWVGDDISGACGAPANSDGVIDSPAPGWVVPPKLNCAFPKLAKIFVPLPSLAKTEPEEKLRTAAPAAFTLKFIVMAFPAAPIKPGLRTMPSKVTAPAELENDGSCTQRVKTEPIFEIETTSSLSGGKEITPEAAFIAWSALETKIFTEKVLPTA